ncbi:FGGY-family carbohydrate kinase [Thiomicrorhabdus sediminis]|nr:FGGY family carbohydrate kinase [Thiomicrorhabdus sediminis]
MHHKTTVILGIDIGTSGIRGCLVERDLNSNNEQILLQHNQSMALPDNADNDQNGVSVQDPRIWIETLNRVLRQLSVDFDLQRVEHLVCDATSSTVLLADSELKPITKALMYNDSQAKAEAQRIASLCQNLNIETAASGASSTLAKALLLINRAALSTRPSKDDAKSVKILHQIDLVNHYLADFDYISDENNALKLGYDSIAQTWPDWVVNLIEQDSSNRLSLPQIVSSGTCLGRVKTSIAQRYGINQSARLYAGTTDSIAGFLATGAHKTGDAVSSLGSSIAVKLVTDKPVFSSQFGLYSHKLKSAWLVGGASNCGGLSLLQFYDLVVLIKLLELIKLLHNKQDYQKQSDCYPLIKTGERFPIADSDKKAVLPEYIAMAKNIDTERIDEILNAARSTNHLSEQQQAYIAPHIDNILHLINGLVNIETLSYQRLSEMSGTQVNRLFSIGGGLQNEIWMALRGLHFKTLHSSLMNNTSTDGSAALGVTRLIEF